MKKILIIGANGFLGKSFIDYFYKRKNIFGYRKLILISRNNISNYKKSTNNIFFIKKNLLNMQSLPNCDSIIYSIKSNNIHVSLKCFKKFKKLLKNLKKKPNIIFTSSGAVYGPIDIKKKIGEDDYNNKNYKNYKNYKKKYSLQKKTLEHKFKLLSNDGYKICIARLFTFYGEHINIKEALPDLIHQGLKKKEIKINSESNVFRSYMSDKKLIIFLLLILNKMKKNYSVLNIGSDKTISINELANIISKILKKKVIKKVNKNNSIDYYVPSVLRLKKLINFKLEENFLKKLNLLIKFYKNKLNI